MDTITTGTSGRLTGISSNFKKFFTGKNSKRNIIVVLLFLGAISYIYYAFLRAETPATFEYATVTKKDIKKTVEGSGKVVSVSELDIQQLQSGGKVTAVYVKPGDFVKKGQVIATLDNRQASIQLQQARASYDKVVNGSTKEEMDITNQAVLNAKQSFEITKQQQDIAVANSKRSLYNSGLEFIPVYDSRIQPNTPTLSGSYACDSEVEYTLTFSSTDIMTLSDGSMIRISSVPQALGNCGLYVSFDMSKDYSNGSWKLSVPNKISSSYATNLASYNNAIAARDQAMVNANTSIVNAELSLNQKKAGARAEDVSSAQASLASANLNYDNTIIRAPFDGQIGSVSAAVGQQTNSQAGVATIITKDKIAEISLNEIDVVNVMLGQPVELTFDAIPGEVFVGSVSQIDTVGINTSNVVSFATKISIPEADGRIKSGMSVTANIITEEKKGVLSVPSATIKTEKRRNEELSYVMKKLEPVGQEVVASQRKIYLTPGLSNDIDTEIVESENNELAEGVQVVSKSSTATVSKQQTTFNLFGGGARPTGGAAGGGNFNRGNTGR